MPKTYYEVVLKGSPELIRAFTTGFIEGRGGKEEEFVENACRIEEDSPLSLVMHFLSIHHTTALVMESSAYQPFSAALRKHRGAMPFEITGVREITGASFDFRYRTNSHETGKALLALFSNLPGDTRMQEGYAPREKNIPEGKGVEAYAPLHDYELQAKGTVTGGIRAVHDLYCRAGRFEVVDLGDLKLVYGQKIQV